MCVGLWLCANPVVCQSSRQHYADGFSPVEASSAEQLCTLVAPLLVRKITEDASLERFTPIQTVTKALRVTVESIRDLNVGAVTGLFGGAPSIKVDMDVYHGDVSPPG